MRLLFAVFGIGFALGMKSDRWLPPLTKEFNTRAQPLGKAALKIAVEATDKARDVFWEKSEKFSDVIAEIKEEQEEEATATHSAPKYDA